MKSVISVACRNKPPGNYAYPSSCTRFIHCDGTGQGNVRMCQKESNFDPEYHVCVWNKIYPCESKLSYNQKISVINFSFPLIDLMLLVVIDTKL